MAEPVLTLKYEKSLNDLRTDFKCIHRRGRRTRLFFVVCIGATAVLQILEGTFPTPLLAVCGVSVIIAAFVFPELMARHIARTRLPTTVNVIVNDRTILRETLEWKQRERFWWSRLKNCEEVDQGFVLSFDNWTGPCLFIPSHAFTDDLQMATFRDLVDQHLPNPVSSHVA